MITTNKRFGPFTPQELDRFVEFLKSENISFEIVKDEKAEREFAMNDGQNAVTRADLRTETYLAQIFSVDVENVPADKMSKIESLFFTREEVPKRFRQDEKIVEFETEAQLTARLNRAARQKRIWASILFLLLLAPMVISWIEQFIKFLKSN